MVEKKKTEKRTNGKPPAAEAGLDSGGGRDLPPLDDGIGARIRQARESRGWTQVALSIRAGWADEEKKGISRTVIVGYEAGTHKPGAREIRLLCKALSITPNWLLFGQEEPFQVLQPSAGVIPGHGREIVDAVRLALSLLLLKSHERALVSSLVLSLGGREVGDARLSGLSMVAFLMAKEVYSRLGEFIEVGEGGIDSLPLRDIMDQVSRAYEGNVGTRLKFDESVGEWTGEWLYKDPRPSEPDPPK